MMLALSLVLLSQAPSAHPIKLASIGFSQVKVPKALATSFEETFALRLSQTGKAQVTTPRDVASVLGIERQKQLLGCATEGSCLAELAGALGAEGIITGEIALVGKVYQLTIKILSPESGRAIFQVLQRCKTEEDVLELLDRAAVDALKILTETLRKPAPAPVVVQKPVVNETPVAAPPVEVVAPAPEEPKPSIAPWVVVGVGGALVVGGAIAESLAVVDYDKLGTAAPSPELGALKEAGKVKQAIGISLLATGGAVVVGGLVWKMLGAPKDAPVANVWVGDSSGGLVVGGAF